MKCKICNTDNKPLFDAKIINKYKVKYYYCYQCGFLQTEEPYWLEEAYGESINISDTGIMSRNLYLTQISTVIIYCFFDKNKEFLDFAGGYGILTRLMRDIGFSFYWNDKYSPNLVARHFEYNKDSKYELLTSFESFEHFNNPILEIEAMLKISKSILFSTDLVDTNVPSPKEWWYYGLEHGQHISFYSLDTLKTIANKYNLNIYTNGKNIHLLTEKKLNNYIFNFVLKLSKYGLFNIIRKIITTKTIDDAKIIIRDINENR